MCIYLYLMAGFIQLRCRVWLSSWTVWISNDISST